MSDGRARLRHALSTLGFLAAAWSFTLVVTSGISFDLGPLHVSSRNARNPAIAALLLLIGAGYLAPAGARPQSVGRDILDFLRRLDAALGHVVRRLRDVLDLLVRPPVLTGLAVLVVLLTLGLSWQRGAFVAGGSDAYGYISEAHLFATGRLRVDSPLAHAFPHIPPDGLTPFGYRPAGDGTDTLVPTYAPGLPLTMAALEVVGGMEAVYLVMPVLAAVAVWCAYAIGARLVGPGVGLGAALLVFASPAFAFQLVGAPMSDICAAGWWTLALALLLRDRPWSTGGAGIAAGLAILTRPNLLLVVVVLGAYLLWLVVHDATRVRERIRRLALFSGPVVVGCLTVAALNAEWYGSPFRSGYPGDLFSADYWDDNIIRYARWLYETQTPLFFIGFAAPFIAPWLPTRSGNIRAATVLLTGTVLAVFASYLFYQPFDVWWYLRFLLPAYPALAVLTCITLAALSDRLGTVVRVLSVAAVAAAAAFGWLQINDKELLGENRYRIIGEWVRDHLPPNAIVISSQHGGNVRHYSGRPIVRYDVVAKGDYEVALDEIIAAGYHPYLVVDEWEIPQVRERHGGGVRGAIDWPPLAVLPLGNVTVWDLAEDRDAARSSARQPQRIPLPESIRRQLP